MPKSGDLPGTIAFVGCEISAGAAAGPGGGSGAHAHAQARRRWG